MKVTPNVRPACVRVGRQLTVAVPGFAVTGMNPARTGRPATVIETFTTGAPGAVAASAMTSSRPTGAMKRLPSTGVGAVQVVEGVTVSRAETEAGSAKQASAATASARCRPPVKRAKR